jgi:hypothetical protein
MSKGLGWLQQEILNSLSQAKNTESFYTGKGFWGDGYVHAHGFDVVLDDQVYDLRETLKHLAKKHEKIYASYVRGSFQASFSRAVKSLLKRGYLKQLYIVPLKEARQQVDDCTITLLSDGLHLVACDRQIRFVTKMAKIHNT